MQQSKIFSAAENFLLFLFIISFLSLYLILSLNNRPAADDFFYLGNIADKGAWGCMKELYLGYSGRWVAYLFTGWVFNFQEFRYYLLVFNFITIIFLAAVLNSIIRKMIRRNFADTLPQNISLLYSVVLTAVLFFSSYSIGETWFWTVQVCTYLWSIIMSLVLLNALLEEKFNLLQVPMIILAAIFIGGASESFALVNIFLLAAYLFFSNGRFAKYPARNQTIILSLVFLLLSFAVTMLAPGNEVRLGLLPKVSFAETVWIQLKSFIKIDFIKTPLAIPYLFLFSFPWLVLGKYLSNTSPKETLVATLSPLKKYFFILAALIFIFLLPTSYIMSELGPDRALAQISFLITFCFAALFFYLGQRIEIHEGVFRLLKISILALSTGVIIYQTGNQYVITKKYADAFDGRIEFLKQQAGATGGNSIELEPLPASGMLYSSEISTDTSDFRNEFLKKYAGVNRAIRVKGPGAN